MNNKNNLPPSTEQNSKVTAQAESPAHHLAENTFETATSSMPLSPLPPQIYTPKRREPFNATWHDAAFALVALFLGYYFVKYIFNWEGLAITGFVFLYSGSILALALLKKVKPLKESWYWLAIILATGVSYLFISMDSMSGWRFILLFSLSIYWVATVFGGMLEKRTNNIFMLDILNIVFCVPFQNFSAVFHSGKFFFCSIAKRKKRSPINAENADSTLVTGAKKEKPKHGKLAGVLLGILISIPILVIVLPLLVKADSTGSFRAFFLGITLFISNFINSILYADILSFVMRFIFSLPFSLYIAGLVLGFLHKRYIKNIDSEKSRETIYKMHLLPQSTIFTVLGIISLLYAVFIVSQSNYFFSAFSGTLPKEYTQYSTYARDGFFELCNVVVVNLVILLFANLLSKTPRKENKLLRIFNILLSAITILLIFTAFSKIALYISAQGLTLLRIQVCAFLLFLLCVWVANIILQFFHFSIARVSLFIGAFIFFALCICNLDNIVAKYNLDFYSKKADISENFNYSIENVFGNANINEMNVAEVIEAYKTIPFSDDTKSSIAYALGYTLHTSRYNGVHSEHDSYAHFLVRDKYANDILEIIVLEGLQEYFIYLFPVKSLANYTHYKYAFAATSQNQLEYYLPI